ncbi:hypothetical protein QNH98_10280 [Myroides sp. mNGS23_01]|nr:hypothetical protein [Myroides sp. mNGS23_01]WHT37592.1 hypothetical protein QNH98_10280 [Myroides sp. mNGS23_01]
MMNKTGRLLVLFLMILSLGCSKGDDNTDLDPIYSLEYKPLKSFTELGKKQYNYVGIKIGDKKVGLLSDSDKSCVRLDKVQAHFEDDKLVELVYNRMERDCSKSNKVRLVKNSLNEEGILHTIVHGSRDKLDNLIIDEEGRISLEIGFQGDYLRIEDRMSNFKRTKHNEKVYLYFKRKDI